MWKEQLFGSLVRAHPHWTVRVKQTAYLRAFSKHRESDSLELVSMQSLFLITQKIRQMGQKFKSVSFNAAASKFSMESNLATFYFKPINGIFSMCETFNK